MLKRIGTFLAVLATIYTIAVINPGCGQMGYPTGGPRDSIAPALVRSTPELKSLNVTGNKITLVFDEYVEVTDLQNNLLVSPLQKNNPSVNYNLKTVTIRLRDSLLPNTTYSINFGNAIKDVNEGNALENFTYVFSTGNTIDSGTLSGKLVLAETGLVDSTISVVLYKNLADTAVQNFRPYYLTRIKSDGIFRFNNLPHGNYNIYALKDGDGNKYYNIKTELFAFAEDVVSVSDSSTHVNLFAYSEEKQKDTKITPVLKPALDKTLKVKTNLNGNQDLLKPFELVFNNPLKTFDTSQVILTDTNYNKINAVKISFDSTNKIVSYEAAWVAGQPYFLLLPKDAVSDSANNKPAKSDTIRFTAKEEKEYARVVLRFKNIDLEKNPVLQMLNNNQVAASYPLVTSEWTNSLFNPGEYSIRILYDDNEDGVWTPGNYDLKKQPEKAITLPQKLSLRANWDNERDIEL